MSLEVTKSRSGAELLKAQADPEKAAFFPHFFKTGPGEYGDGDRPRRNRS